MFPEGGRKRKREKKERQSIFATTTMIIRHWQARLARDRNRDDSDVRIPRNAVIHDDGGARAGIIMRPSATRSSLPRMYERAIAKSECSIGAAPISHLVPSKSLSIEIVSVRLWRSSEVDFREYAPRK